MRTGDSGNTSALTQALSVDSRGWCFPATHLPSPNFDARPPGTRPELLVIHNISLPPGQFGGDAILRLFTNTLDYSAHPYYDALRGLRVSAHFLIRRDGGLLQFVSIHARAWHAGVSSYRGRERCNDFSIGVELEGCDDQPFEAAQYRTLAALTRALAAVCPLHAVAAHSEIAPGRKTDPGALFDWPRYLALAAVPLQRACPTP